MRSLLYVYYLNGLLCVYYLYATAGPTPQERTAFMEVVVGVLERGLRRQEKPLIVLQIIRRWLRSTDHTQTSGDSALSRWRKWAGRQAAHQLFHGQLDINFSFLLYECLAGL